MATPSTRLDHLTVVAPTLEGGCDWVEAALGVRPGPGRQHPSMGTHNALLALGPAAYLEVIAVDPAAPPPARPRWFGLDRLAPGTTPRLAAWVCATDDIEAACAAAAAPAFGRIETMRRAQHTWRITLRDDGAPPFAGAAPLLIQREPGADPLAALPRHGLALQALVVRHPEPGALRMLLDRIGLAGELRVTVGQGERCGLVARIATPSGPRMLPGEARAASPH